MKEVYCPVRKACVAALPEEYVRQHLLKRMIEQLGYPIGLITVEKALRQLPHLSVKDRRMVPDRRADVLCFTPSAAEGLRPLLLIECKSVSLTEKVMSQLIGYNHFVKASFIAMANQEEVCMGWFDPIQQKYLYINRLPAYQELSKKISSP